jgi:hypothetical protein
MITLSFRDRIRLVNEPSVGLWELELHRLVSGERFSSIIVLGDAQEYVDSVLLESTDYALSQHCFYQALRLVVREWNPEPGYSRSSMACMLDLISAYIPSEGYLKIMTLLSENENINHLLDIDSWYPSIEDLHLRALLVLGKFFPGPPLDAAKDSAFGAYVALIRRHLDKRKFAGYATLRLLELRILDPTDFNVLDKLLNSPETLGDFISLVIAVEPRDRLQEFIRPLYWEVMRRSGHFGFWFFRALHAVGAFPENGDNGPILSLENGEIIDLEIPDGDSELLLKYMTARDQWESLEGWEKGELVASLVLDRDEDKEKVN